MLKLMLSSEMLCKKCNDTLSYHEKYIVENGVDIPEVVNYKWHGKTNNI